MKKDDYSEICNFDETNKCFQSKHFVFPIGCMFNEDIKEGDN